MEFVVGADERGIFALLMEFYNQEGAVPRELEIAH
jgi:hypothetical protein